MVPVKINSDAHFHLYLHCRTQPKMFPDSNDSLLQGTDKEHEDSNIKNEDSVIKREHLMQTLSASRCNAEG